MRGSPTLGSSSDPPGELCVAVISPKLDEFSAPLGLSKFARLITLKASNRVSMRRRSRMGKLRLNVISTLNAPGPCMALRPAVPNVPIGFAAKATPAGTKYETQDVVARGQ